jgi:hypothetical protein
LFRRQADEDLGRLTWFFDAVASDKAPAAQTQRFRERRHLFLRGPWAGGECAGRRSEKRGKVEHHLTHQAVFDANQYWLVSVTAHSPTFTLYFIEFDFRKEHNKPSFLFSKNFFNATHRIISKRTL